MVEKNQQFIFNTDELSLIKNTFAEKEPLLYLIRKVLLQFPLTSSEVVHLQTAINDDVISVLRKRILPELTPDYPLGQIPSMMTTLTDQLRMKDVNDMDLQFQAKLIEEQYIKQQFKALEALVAGEKLPKPSIVLADLGKMEDKTAEQNFVDMTAYLFLLGYIDPMLIFIRSIAGDKEETVEQQKDRMTRNSSK